MIVQTDPMVSMSSPFLFTPREAAFHRLRHRNALRQRKTHGGVDADTAIRRFLDRRYPGGRAGIFTMMFGARCDRCTAWRMMASASR